jgi:hypothetical protein
MNYTISKVAFGVIGLGVFAYYLVNAFEGLVHQSVIRSGWRGMGGRLLEGPEAVKYGAQSLVLAVLAVFVLWWYFYKYQED